LTLQEFRRRFAQARLSDASVYGDESPRPDPETLRPAAVLVPVVDRQPGPTVLLTQRAAHLKEHSGQVSFPGGRVQADDASPDATALREAHEEIGLDAARVELLGRMPEYLTGTGFRITPVVGIVTPPFDLRADANEVEEIFEVPLDFLLDVRNHQRQSREWQGELRWFFAMPYEGHYIWGATAGMLVNLSRLLAQVRL
jgi:8-oxo-dGTP pyrophosphatase MutT (NUDIX family)